MMSAREFKAMLLGTIDDPEVQKAIREAIGIKIHQGMVVAAKTEPHDQYCQCDLCSYRRAMRW
jgi:hypothetical protein